MQTLWGLCEIISFLWLRSGDWIKRPLVSRMWRRWHDEGAREILKIYCYKVIRCEARLQTTCQVIYSHHLSWVHCRHLKGAFQRYLTFLDAVPESIAHHYIRAAQMTIFIGAHSILNVHSPPSQFKFSDICSSRRMTVSDNKHTIWFYLHCYLNICRVHMAEIWDNCRITIGIIEDSTDNSGVSPCKPTHCII